MNNLRVISLATLRHSYKGHMIRDNMTSVFVFETLRHSYKVDLFMNNLRLNFLETLRHG